MRNGWVSLIGVAFAACGPSSQQAVAPQTKVSASGSSCPGLHHQTEARGVADAAKTAKSPLGEVSDVTAEVKRIIKEQLDVDEKDIRLDASFIDDLGADSLGLVDLVLAFEEAFEIDIPDEDTENVRTVDDAIQYILRATKPASTASSPTEVAQ